MSDNDGNGEKEVRRLKKTIQLGETQDLDVEFELDPTLIKNDAFVKAQSKKLAKELTDLGLPTDSSEIDTSNIQAKAKELSELRERREKEREQASIDADPTRRGSSGTLTLEGQGYSGGEGYDSYEELIDDLRRRKASGKTAEERETASTILKELMRKTIAGKKLKDFPINIGGGDEATIEAFKKEERKRRKDE